jgi:hypothetical protein
VSVEDDERSGLPSTSKTTENVEEIRKLIHKDRRQTIDDLSVSYVVCQDILTENLNMRCIVSSSQQRARPHVPENHRVCD